MDATIKRNNNSRGCGKDFTISRILADKTTKHSEEELLGDIRKVCKNMDDETFIILQLILDGLNKSEIIKKLKITSNKLDKKIKSLNSNKKLKTLLFN
jgi:DNA-binding NtrC family response regulator